MRKIDAIVIHHAAHEFGPLVPVSSARDTIADWHRARFGEIGYHYVIRRGQSICARDVARVGAHVKGFNKRTIGVCFAYDCRETPMLSAADRHCFWGLYQGLRTQGVIRAGTPVIGHNVLAATLCPGSYAEQLVAYAGINGDYL